MAPRYRLTSATWSAFAAIFDLDRTVLRGPSGPALNEALVELGLRRGKLFGETALYRTYELFGENPLGMALARAAALGVRGWSVDRMRASGRRAAELLAPQVGSYVPSLLAEHRRAGHLLVLATTTPDVLIRPLARRLGFDEVIATRYAWRDGAYTGALEGGFVWGPGKLAAVRRWAANESVELRGSFAYSDSVYDLPLLSAVGNPAAANPDPTLHAIALLRRWPVLHLDSPPGVVTLFGAEAFDLAKRAVRPELFPYARFDIEGIEHIPDAGPFLLVSNHRSYFDVAALSIVVARKGRRTRFLAKKELFDAPVVGQIARALGGIAVERQGAAADSLVAAQRVLVGGGGARHPAPGHDPPGPGLLRPGARWQDRRRPPRGSQRRSGHPRRALEYRGGLATLVQIAEGDPGGLATDGPGSRRAGRLGPRPAANRRPARHRGDHGGDRRALARRGPPCATSRVRRS